MKTLLIVEDEKMIRSGIAVMVKRSSVPVEEVLECRNGVEALELLKKHPVDVMFTDIKMPKMDGVELVKQLEDLPNRPLVIVISGYDDFSYTVSMLQCGVRDYILKPIKREKVEEILLKLEKELEKKQAEIRDQNQNFKNQVKYFLHTSQIMEEEWQSANRQFERIFGGKPYRIVLGGGNQKPVGNCQLELGTLDEEQVFFLTEEQTEEWKQCSEKCGLGFSAGHVEFRECGTALAQAKSFRRIAFIKEKKYAGLEDAGAHKEEGTEGIPEQFVEQFIQQFPTDRGPEALRQLQQYFFQAKHQDLQTDQFLMVVSDIQRAMLKKYGAFAPEETRKQGERPILYWNLAKDYLEAQENWMKSAWQNLQEQFGENQNQARIRDAQRYIQENFSRDINMALVSNHVSMNYSLFSIAFKEYTGTNFVNYLKNIRMAEAKRLLETTDEKILEISRQVGYDNEKHFMKTFKNICGISASEYRKNIAAFGEK
ncbi:MAG: response regulator [Lachnospiraceae bacterium]|nr:response regulator [Lachnospiraceae bacterium]MDD3795752.1 response regulator [Lachnospiraceae bacterium]